MKAVIYKFILTFLFLNITSLIYSQDYWSQLNGPFGGEVISVQKNSAGDLLALRNEGLYISNNNAEIWNKLPASSAHNGLCMDVSPSGIIYVGKSSGGIWWTANKGQSWSHNRVHGDPHGGIWASVYVAKVNPSGHVYINGYVSFNGGTNFIPLVLGGFATVPVDYAFNASSVYAATNNGVFHSVNNGSSWTIINGNLPSLNATSLMFDNNVLIAGINGSGIYRTTDNGSSWVPINNGLTDLSVIKIYRDSQNNYFAGTANGKVFRSVNAGSSWTEIFSSESGNTINSITSEAGIIYLSTKNYGVLRSGDNGVTWNEKNSNFYLSFINSLAFSNTGEIFSGGYFGINYSSDNGSNWHSRNTGLPSKLISSVFRNSDKSILAAVNNSGIYRSSDNGLSWISSSNGIPGIANIKVIISSPGGSLFAASIPDTFLDTLKIYRSGDNGFNWTKILQPQSPGMDQFTIDAGGNIYVGGINETSQLSLLISMDGGDTWNETIIEEFFDMQKLTASGNNIYMTFGPSIFYSSDMGDTWNAIDNDESWNVTGFTAIGVNSLGHIFGAIGENVYLTTNTGDSWIQKNSGLAQNTDVNKFIFNDAGYVFGLTSYGGIFKSAQSTLTHTAVNITLAVEGLYDTATNGLRKRDSVRVYLRNNITPFSIVDSASSVIDSVTMVGNFMFVNAPSGTYYLHLKYRNGIETWSRSGGESLKFGNIFSYDFTTSASRAFGSNMIQVDTAPVRFAIYSGDVNQNGAIDLTDIIFISNNSVSFVNGYVVSDLNGDNVTNLTDILFSFNNSNKFVVRIIP